MLQRPTGLPAVTQDDRDYFVSPASPSDWADWVSATAIRNYLLEDTLVDWLDAYGRSRGFAPDDERNGFDPRTDFTAFLLRKASAFEQAVLAALEDRVEVVTIGHGGEDARSLGRAQATVEAMQAGVAVISQAVLRNPNSRTYGVADLLVRSDRLVDLVPGTITPAEADIRAPGLRGASWHYRVVDIKFTTLHLLVSGELANNGSFRAYRGQLFVYNEALGRLQGYCPTTSYLLGRSWAQTISKEKCRGTGCFERLARVVHGGTPESTAMAGEVADAVQWVRSFRRQGNEWQVLPEPSVPQLRPNMSADGGRWTYAKREIAIALEELTVLWHVGLPARSRANAAEVYRWTDPRCTAETLGITGEKTGPTLQAVLDINRSDGPPVAPATIRAAVSQWCRPNTLHFYVDFETVSDLADDFSTIPARGGTPMIFMIGCGHLERGQWRFASFTAQALTEACESTVLDKWLDHMRAVRERLGFEESATLVIHWSPAETSTLRDAYNAAMRRHPARAVAWAKPLWFDFLTEVIRAEPVVVRGAFGFGLKQIAKALSLHSLIQTCWPDGPGDGLGAMAGAWACAAEAKHKGIPLTDVDLMSQIERYNEMDCKVMMEVVHYLRDHHVAHAPRVARNRPSHVAAAVVTPPMHPQQDPSAVCVSGYRVAWDSSGLSVHAFETNLAPLRLEWAQLSEYADRARAGLEIPPATTPNAAFREVTYAACAVIRAPSAGRIRWRMGWGEVIDADEVFAWIDGEGLVAPVTGLLVPFPDSSKRPETCRVAAGQIIALIEPVDDDDGLLALEREERRRDEISPRRSRVYDAEG